jgi:hypothetical protein
VRFRLRAAYSDCGARLLCLDDHPRLYMLGAERRQRRLLLSCWIARRRCTGRASGAARVLRTGFRTAAFCGLPSASPSLRKQGSGRSTHHLRHHPQKPAVPITSATFILDKVEVALASRSCRSACPKLRLASALGVPCLRRVDIGDAAHITLKTEVVAVDDTVGSGRGTASAKPRPRAREPAAWAISFGLATVTGAVVLESAIPRRIVQSGIVAAVPNATPTSPQAMTCHPVRGYHFGRQIFALVRAKPTPPVRKTVAHRPERNGKETRSNCARLIQAIGFGCPPSGAIAGGRRSRRDRRRLCSRLAQAHNDFVHDLKERTFAAAKYSAASSTITPAS